MNLILQWEPSETKFHSAESISGQTGKFLDKSSRAGDSMAYRFDGIILIIRWISFNLVGGDNFCPDERNSPPPLTTRCCSPIGEYCACQAIKTVLLGSELIAPRTRIIAD